MLEQVTVAGGGTLGSQIAFQSAFFGKQVIVYDISEDAIEKARQRLANLDQNYRRDMQATPAQLVETHQRIQLTTLPEKAFSHRDLIIEAVPEVPTIKINLYKQVATFRAANTILASNSSTFLPSQFADETGAPAQFANLHFANSIWQHNTAEIMGHAGTSVDTIHQLTEFAKSIQMVPIVLKKEQPGYVLNTMLTPFLENAAYLWGAGIVDAPTVDQTWMIGTGAPEGPFGIIDKVGLRTFYSIESQRKGNDPEYQPILEQLKAMIDRDALGAETGHGFYDYPDPAYERPDFLV